MIVNQAKQLKMRINSSDKDVLTRGSKRKIINDCERPQKIRRIMSTLPDHMIAKNITKPSTSASLETFLMTMVKAKGINVKVQPVESIDNFFCDPTKEEIEAYGNDVSSKFQSIS